MELAANLGIIIEHPLLGHSKAVLDLKSGILVEQAVFLKALKAVLIINMEKFHRVCIRRRSKMRWLPFLSLEHELSCIIIASFHYARQSTKNKIMLFFKRTYRIYTKNPLWETTADFIDD